MLDKIFCVRIPPAGEGGLAKYAEIPARNSSLLPPATMWQTWGKQGEGEGEGVRSAGVGVELFMLTYFVVSSYLQL